jgi:hypothetical protein
LAAAGQHLLGAALLQAKKPAEAGAVTETA